MYKVKEAKGKDSRATVRVKFDKTQTSGYNKAGGGEEVSGRCGLCFELRKEALRERCCWRSARVCFVPAAWCGCGKA
jgi:hypothetical protein